MENSIHARGTRAGTICEFMVKYGQMKHLASITALILPACAYASTGVAVPPPSDFVDTEAVTNVVFDAGDVYARRLDLGITVR